MGVWPSEREENFDKFPLNVTNIDRDDTMFSASIFSVKQGDKNLNDSMDYEILLKEKESEILKSLDPTPFKDMLEDNNGSYGKNNNTQFLEGESVIGEGKKRRSRAERKKGVLSNNTS